LNQQLELARQLKGTASASTVALRGLSRAAARSADQGHK
jgi:hypothetical protein